MEVCDFKEQFFKKYIEISSVIEINSLLAEGKEGMQENISSILK